MASTQFLETLELAQKKYFNTTSEMSGLIGGNLVIHMVDTGDALPKWWSTQRDRVLYETMLKSNHLSGLAYTAMTKLANIPLTFKARDTTITSQVERADVFNKMIRVVSEGGEGLRITMKRFILDYLITDNGGFMEIMGDGPADGPILGMPWGLKHLDSLQCRRTGNSEYPVAFIDEGGKRYKLHFSRVVYFAQQPSALARKRGVGFGSMSRSHLLGEVLQSQIVYKMEKMGTRPSTKLFVGDGISAEQMMSAFIAAKNLQDQQGLEYFGRNVFVGGDGIGLDATDLNNFDPFDEEVGTLMAMYALAFCWGLKIQEIWPVTGSKSSDEVSNMQARGRLPADFMADMKEQLEHKLCPPYIEAVYDYQDDDQDMTQANIRDIRSRAVARVAEYEVIDTPALRRIMMENGEISRSEFRRQQLADGFLEDGTPIGALFHSSDSLLRNLLKLDGVKNPLIFEENDPEAMIAAIHVQQNACLMEIGSTKSESRKRRALEAGAALEWLKSEYESLQMKDIREQGMENQEEEQEEKESGDEQPSGQAETSEESSPETE